MCGFRPGGAATSRTAGATVVSAAAISLAPLLYGTATGGKPTATFGGLEEAFLRRDWCGPTRTRQEALGPEGLDRSRYCTARVSGKLPGGLLEGSDRGDTAVFCCPPGSALATNQEVAI